MQLPSLALGSLALLAATAPLTPAALGQLPVVERISVDSSGVQANDQSIFAPDLSADGRYVVFVSTATNLVSGDTNLVADVFRHDRVTGQTIRCSVATGGGQSDEGSSSPCISADGRYVCFSTRSGVLDPADLNDKLDVYLRDCLLGTTELISVGLEGQAGNDLSSIPSISDDGTRVAFQSAATDLVPVDGNGTMDIFVRDRAIGRTAKVSQPAHTSLETDGFSHSPAISGDGRYVVYVSMARNMGLGESNPLPDIYLFDYLGGNTFLVSLASHGGPSKSTFLEPDISDDGRFVSFTATGIGITPEDLGPEQDVFVRDLLLGRTELISVSSGGQQGGWSNMHPLISGNGRYVVWSSQSDVFLPKDGSLYEDVFVRDRWAGVTELVSATSGGIPGYGDSYDARLDRDGRHVAYLSKAANLVEPDTNGVSDVLLLDRLRGELRLGLGPAQAGRPASLHLRRGTAGAHVVVLLSVGPQQLGGGPHGLLSLGPAPIALPLSLDAGGSADLLIPIPPWAKARDLWLQAIDGSTGLVSNAWWEVVH